MAVDVVVVGRKNPRDPAAPKKFYSQTKSTGDVDLRQLSTQISEVSTVSTIDTMAVLEGLVKVIPQKIAEGKIVRLGDFGNFSLSVRGEGAAKETEVTVANIKSNHMNFRPGKEVKKVLDNIEYKKA